MNAYEVCPLTALKDIFSGKDDVVYRDDNSDDT